MRPKSIATVVVVLRSDTPPASSTPTECSVIAASVLRGSMSEMEPMKVVLPTAKPPATTILTTVGATLPAVPAGAATAASEGGNAIENTLQHAEGQGRGLTGVDLDRLRGVHTHDMLFGQVGHEDPNDAQRQVEQGRQLGDRDVVRRCVLQDRPLLRRQTLAGDGARHCLDQGLERQGGAPRAHAATGHGIGPDRSGLVLDVLAHCRDLPAAQATGARVAPSTGSWP